MNKIKDPPPIFIPETAPSHAVSLWKEGDSLKVLLDGRVITIKLQSWEWLPDGRICGNSESGLATCPMGGLRTLALLAKARETLPFTNIGTIASPTQWDITHSTLNKTAKAEARLAKALETKQKVSLAEKAKTKASFSSLLEDNDALLKALGL